MLAGMEGEQKDVAGEGEGGRKEGCGDTERKGGREEGRKDVGRIRGRTVGCGRKRR